MTGAMALRKLAADLGEILRFGGRSPDLAYVANLLLALVAEGRVRLPG